MNNYKELQFQDVPNWYALCFLTDCPQAGDCLRHRAATLAPATLTRAVCVTPQARRDGPCRHFSSCGLRPRARGFQRGFLRLKSRDARYELRQELTRFFGSTGSFYRYRQGRRMLDEMQRRHVVECFGRYGLGADDVFDEQWMGHHFDHGGEQTVFLNLH